MVILSFMKTQKAKTTVDFRDIAILNSMVNCLIRLRSFWIFLTVLSSAAFTFFALFVPRMAYPLRFRKFFSVCFLIATASRSCFFRCSVTVTGLSCFFAMGIVFDCFFALFALGIAFVCFFAFFALLIFFFTTITPISQSIFCARTFAKLVQWLCDLALTASLEYNLLRHDQLLTSWLCLEPMAVQPAIGSIYLNTSRAAYKYQSREFTRYTNGE